MARLIHYRCLSKHICMSSIYRTYFINLNDVAPMCMRRSWTWLRTKPHREKKAFDMESSTYSIPPNNNRLPHIYPPPLDTILRDSSRYYTPTESHMWAWAVISASIPITVETRLRELNVKFSSARNNRLRVSVGAFKAVFSDFLLQKALLGCICRSLYSRTTRLRSVVQCFS